MRIHAPTDRFCLWAWTTAGTDWGVAIGRVALNVSELRGVSGSSVARGVGLILSERNG
jgi:hypothetical protein